MRRALRIAPLVTLALFIGIVILVWWLRTSEFVAQDACLDSGGRWGEDVQCQFEQPAE